ncbi:SIS domain-containing protein [Bacillus sp. IITD106]|nr:SIS domain-containing protein [Bacillus sp. IITD106]
MNALDYMKEAIDIQSQSIEKLMNQINRQYREAIEMMKACKGKIVVTGVGKSGHIGKKFAASLASTGSPSFFVHSCEGVHGDLGMIQKDDIVFILSNSGETPEVLHLLPTLEKIGTKNIVLTSGEHSSLARWCDIALIYKYDKEADHLGLAPTTSSTMSLLIADALAIALSRLKNFDKETFHLFHPGGDLGRRLSVDE